VVFLRIGPRGQPSDPIDLAEETAHQLVAVLPGTQLIDVGNQPGERRFNVCECLLGVVLPLLLETLAVPDELFVIELRTG
jgi:hypothetical protein